MTDSTNDPTPDTEPLFCLDCGRKVAYFTLHGVCINCSHERDAEREEL